MPTIPDALAIAIQHHQGRPAASRRANLSAILALQPNHADALHLLGVIASQVGKLDEAVPYFRRALELKPDYPAAHNNLGNALRARESWPKRPPATAGRWNCSRTLPRRTVTWLSPSGSRASRKKRWPAVAGPWNSSRTTPRHRATWAMPCGTREAGRSRGLLPPGAGTQAGLCRGAVQPGQRLEGPGEAGRSRGLLPPRSRTDAGLCRGARQPGQCTAGARETGRSGGQLPSGAGA